ncbi:hypothetical protein ABFX02_06G193100 [Erythranthe guttata]
MGKLGKKARKFAKKHLQSVLRTRRKTKPTFKKRGPKNGQKGIEEKVDKSAVISNGRSTEYESVENTALDVVFIENDKDEVVDASDSDGYLSEDSSFPIVGESKTAKTLEDEIATTTYSTQNKKIHADLSTAKKKLDKLKKKDPEFSKFLESFKNSAESFQDDEAYSDDGDLSDQEAQGEDESIKHKPKLLTDDVINAWCQMVKEDNNQSALISLLNAYRAACHYGTESIGHTIENSQSFCNVLLFTLSNADDVFRGLLQMSSSKSKKETLTELKKTPKWKSLKPLVKSFLRSTLFLLNQVTDSDILTFAMTRLRASLIFFDAFSSLVQPLIKAAVHLWATGGPILSSASFLVIRDFATMFGSKYYDTCLSKTFVAFISRSRVTEIADIKHMQFLRDCVVELFSVNVKKSSLKSVDSMTRFSKILICGFQTKKKEAIKKICSWEYINCIDLWVRFISANIRDHDNKDLQYLFFMTIQLIVGLANMFSGPRYFPLRLKCIEWLNSLSISSGDYIPLAPLVLDILEYKVVKEGKRAQNAFNIGSVLKLPKQYLKSRIFQDICFQSAVEQLCLHFAQWSYHISFPDLATIPLIRLRKIHEAATIENLRRMLKRLIDQNVDFVQRKRDEVSFSPHEHESADSFLQLEKSSTNASFTQYYKSILDKAAERKLQKCGDISLPEQRNLKRNRVEPKRKPVGAEDHQNGLTVENGVIDTNRRRRALQAQ